MKNIILCAAIVGVAGVLSVASVSHYRAYHNKQLAEASKLALVQQRDQMIIEGRYNTVKLAYDHERQECEKGRAAYDVLVKLSKTPGAMPVCGPAVLKQQ